MRLTPADFTDAEDVRRESRRSPHARQLCQGSNRQLDTRLEVRPASVQVECPLCLKKSTTDQFAKDGATWHPIVASHLPDPSGLIRAQTRAKERKSREDRPF